MVVVVVVVVERRQQTSINRRASSSPEYTAVWGQSQKGVPQFYFCEFPQGLRVLSESSKQSPNTPKLGLNIIIINVFFFYLP